MKLHKTLDEQETKDFIQWADDNKKDAEHNPIIHPVITARWQELGLIK